MKKARPGEISATEFRNSVLAVPKLKFADTIPIERVYEPFYNNKVKISLEAATDLNQNTSSQNTVLWATERKLRITASSCYSIFTYSKNKTTNWQKKYSDLHKGVTTSAMIYGKNTEAAAFSSYQKEEPLVKRSGFCVNPTYPWLGCSPDGIVVEKRKLLEIKCPVKLKNEPFSLEHCKFLEQSDSDNLSLKKKHVYYGQVQLGMFLMNCSSADLVIYSKFTDSHVTINIKYDYYFVLQLVETLNKVYFTVLLPIICNEIKEI
jgi:putative phage-type endonuclease